MSHICEPLVLILALQLFLKVEREWQEETSENIGQEDLKKSRDVEKGWGLQSKEQSRPHAVWKSDLPSESLP